jgi:tetratricopeptide (TPR) repeat protein
MAKKKNHRNRKTNSRASSKDVSQKVQPNFVVKYRMGLLLGGLVVLVLLIYSSGMNGPFIFDDMSNIEYNPHIRLTELSFDGLKKAAFDSPAGSRPVANVSFAFNYLLHDKSTFGYHLVNVLIHAAAGIFLYFFICVTLSTPALRSNFQNTKWIAFISALIWLVHPLQTQSVTYLVQRMNSLAAMFYIMALFFYARGRLSQAVKKRCLWFGASVLSGLLAFGSKQTAASLPVFIFLYEWYFFQDLSWPWFKRRMLPLAGVLVLFGVLALVYLNFDPLETIMRGYDKRDFTPFQRVLTQLRVVIFYISLLIFPHPSRLNLDRDFDVSLSIIDPITTLVCMAAVAALLLSAWRLAPRQRLLSFCILWFLGNLVIESSIIGLEIIFDHRTYLPSMMVCLPAVAFLHPHLRPKWLGIGVLAAVVSVFSFWTHERNAVFRDQITIWADCAAKSPDKSRPHNNLGIFLKKKGKVKEAIAHFKTAVEIDPEYASAHINLGASYVRLRQHEKALAHFSEAIRLGHNIPEAHYSMGNVMALQGRSDEAREHYEKALEANSDYADAHLKLADILDRKGQTQEAVAHYREALRLNPDSHRAHNNLGATLAAQGHLEQAIDHFTRALQISPNDAEAHFNMGTARANQGRYQEAAACFSKALQINPKDREAQRNLEKVRELMKHNGALRSDAGHSPKKPN